MQIYCRSVNIRDVSRISRGGQIREFNNHVKMIIINGLMKKNENSRILRSHFDVSVLS